MYNVLLILPLICYSMYHKTLPLAKKAVCVNINDHKRSSSSNNNRKYGGSRNDVKIPGSILLTPCFVLMRSCVDAATFGNFISKMIKETVVRKRVLVITIVDVMFFFSNLYNMRE